MSLVKITFDGSSVSAKQDADINHHVTGLVPSGIIAGLGGEAAVSVSNNYIAFRSGYVQIYGRRIYVEEGSSVYVSLDSTKYGYAIIQVDLTANTATLTKVEGSSYPTLTQQDLSNGGTVYQMPLAKYSKTVTSITLDSSWSPTYIRPANEIAEGELDDYKEQVAEKHGDYYIPSSQITVSGHYRTVPIKAAMCTSSIICIVMTGTTVFIPGSVFSRSSTLTQTYNLYGTDYQMHLEWSSDDKLSIYLAETTHTVKEVILFRHGG